MPKIRTSELTDAALDWAVAKRPTFPRADPEALQAFNPSTKTCVMNCGPHMLDPRDDKERKFLCDDCLSHNRRSTNDEDLKWL